MCDKAIDILLWLGALLVVGGTIAVLLCDKGSVCYWTGAAAICADCVGWLIAGICVKCCTPASDDRLLQGNEVP